MQRGGCELCEGVAALYCAADKAHLCWTCDAKVHSANFLVARHTRSVLCTTCATLTPWRTSGPNPSPLTGLCANCSQGESQGECTTHNDDATGNARRVSTAVAVANSRAVSGYESGCSSSNPDGKVVEGDTTVRDSPCESASQLSEDVESSVTVDSRSVSSGISQSLKRKSLGSCSPGGLTVSPSKQIATRALEDVNRSVARGQCECANTTSSSSESRRDTHANHQLLEFTTVVLSSAKRQRMDDRGAPMRPSLQLSAMVSTSRLMRMLAKWHWDLHLSSPGTVPLALRMFRKVSRALAPAVLSNSGMRVTLAACLRLAAGLDEAQIVVPKASEVAACAGVSTRRLAMTEIHLLALLGWRRFPMWAGVRT